MICATDVFDGMHEFCDACVWELMCCMCCWFLTCCGNHYLCFACLLVDMLHFLLVVDMCEFLAFVCRDAYLDMYCWYMLCVVDLVQLLFCECSVCFRVYNESFVCAVQWASYQV